MKTTSARFELVSFDLCPYVQRSVITLLHKKIDFKLTFIDLANPPEWFNRISPLGKVPLLLVREREGAEPVTLFESAVINEYLDEVTPPALLPSDPLAKARERAWVAVSGELFMTSYPMMTSTDLGEVLQSKREIFEILEKVEEALGNGPYFTGSRFSLVDAAFAPFFVRMDLFKSMRESPEWSRLPKTARWSKHLQGLPEVRESVVSGFKEKFAAYIREQGAAWAGDL